MGDIFECIYILFKLIELECHLHCAVQFVLSVLSAVKCKLSALSHLTQDKPPAQDSVLGMAGKKLHCSYINIVILWQKNSTI